MEKNPVSGTDLLTAESDFRTDATTTPSHEDIASFAYALWQERGGGYGGADQDWFEAERQLRTPESKAQAA